MAQAGNDIEPQEGEESAKDSPSSPTFWLSQIEAAEKAAEESRKITRRAWDEFLARTSRIASVKEGASAEARYPVYWSSIRTMQPAIYSRTPLPVSQKVFDSLEDKPARLASVGQERLAKYLMRACPFDRVQYATRDDFLMGGKATNRVFFDSDIQQVEAKQYLQQQPMPGPDGQPSMGWFDDSGQPVPPDAVVMQDEDGSYISAMEDSLESVECQLLPVYYYDILHTPNARHWEEVDWLSFKAPMKKRDVSKRFGEEIAELLTYKPLVHTEDDKADTKPKRGLSSEYADIWEIWDKSERTVRWLAPCYKEKFLDEKPDPYELAKFFPCPPFILGTIGAEDMYAVPDYAQLEPLISQIHGMAKRLKTIIRATRQRGIADAAFPELQDLASDTAETEFLLIENFSELVGDGGLERLVKFFPTEKFAETAKLLSEALQMYEQKFYEIYGLPDVLRGTSDPEETASAQQLKGRFLSLRFSSIQREFQRLVRDDVELLCDLALKKFPEQKLIHIMGFDRLQPDEAPLVPEVMKLLRDDKERQIRIEIETDSTITMNENAEIEQRNYLAKTLFDGLSSLSQVGETAPEMKPVIAEAILYLVRGVRDGKQIEDKLAGAIGLLTQPKPPEDENKPDPMEMQKMQIQQAQVMSNEKVEMGKLQMKSRELDISEQKAAADTQLTAMQQSLDEQARKFDQEMTARDHELQQMKVVLEEREKWITEMRLQREDHAKMSSAGSPKKRRYRIKHNDDNTSEVEMEEDLGEIADGNV